MFSIINRVGVRKALDNPYWIFAGFSILMLVYGLFLDSLRGILRGLTIIVNSPDILLTDYIEIAGIGAAFVNSGMVMLISVLLLVFFRHEPTRFTITTLMLAGGFAFFGKNPVNIAPILLGGFLFSVYAKEPFRNNVLATLLGTTLSPAVSQLAFVEFTYSTRAFGILGGVVIGVIIGFVIEPLAKNSMKSHEGYNLYNSGFAAGILGVIIMSVFRCFGIDFRPVSILSSGNDEVLALFVVFMSIYFIGVGGVMIGSLEECLNQFFIKKEGGNIFSEIHGLEYIKMGFMGVFVTIYVMLFGFGLNGPVMGGVLTIAGFSCSGKKITNIFPVMAGSTACALINIYEYDSTVTVLAILFSTCLSPIAEKFGWFWGFVAGFIHLAVSLNIGIINGGLNLYNNGLAGGFVVMTLIPLIRVFSRRQEEKG